MEYKTISQMFYHSMNNSLDEQVIFYKDKMKWKGLTGRDVLSIVEKISFSLYTHDIRYQDKIAILSNTSYKWALCDYGIVSMGAVTTTVYPSLLPNQIEYILNDSESKIVFVEDEMQLEKVKTIFDQCKYLKKIVVMNTPLGNVQATSELTMGIIHSLLRKIHLANQSMHNKKWEKKNFVGSELLGRTIGIVGFGNIGKKISEFSHAYGMKVIVNSSSLKEDE